MVSREQWAYPTWSIVSPLSVDIGNDIEVKLQVWWEWIYLFLRIYSSIFIDNKFDRIENDLEWEVIKFVQLIARMKMFYYQYSILLQKSERLSIRRKLRLDSFCDYFVFNWWNVSINLWASVPPFLSDYFYHKFFGQILSLVHYNFRSVAYGTMKNISTTSLRNYKESLLEL